MKQTCMRGANSRMTRVSRFAAGLIGLMLAQAAPADDVSPTQANEAVVSRLKAALLIETLNAELLSHDSATLTLERWCRRYGLADPPALVAERVPGVDKTPTEDQRRELRVSATDTVRYRRVRLLCGPLVLSEADNWYVPARLTQEMNQLLDTTEEPFGKVVRSLNFQRHTISATLLWPEILPPDWERMPRSRLAKLSEPCLPGRLLEHRALLTLPDGTPLSEVVETYTANVLAIRALGLTPCAK